MTVLSKPYDDKKRKQSMGFLFFSETNPMELIRNTTLAIDIKRNASLLKHSKKSTNDEDDHFLKDLAPRFQSTAETAFSMGVNLFSFQRAALVFPAAATGSLVGAISMSCVPMIAPFNTPPVAYNAWVQNKRAVAFQRSLMYLCVLQGGMAMFKFFSGNLIGGFFDAMIAGTGIYAASPEGVTMLPSYLVFAGFNGAMDFLQLFQMYHGQLPIYLLPFQYPAFRPLLLLLGCYFTYEFHKELTAVFRGYGCCGPQDSFFVQLMGADFWGTPPGCQEAEERRQETSGQPQGFSRSGAGPQNWGSGMLGSGMDGPVGDPQAPRRPSFAPFGGEGRRLGHDQA